MSKNDLRNKDVKSKIYSDDFSESLLNSKHNSGKISFIGKMNSNKDLPLKENTVNLNSQKEKEDLHNLNLSRYYLTISNIFYCLSALSLKIMEQVLPDYNIYLMVSFRFIFFASAAYFFIYKNDIKISSIFELKNKKWFYARIISNFLGLITYKYSFDYIRLGLSLSLVMFAPIWGNLFSIYFFKEKFDIKYLIGCFFCLLGTYLIGLGENKGINDEFTVGTLIGVFFGISNSFCTAAILMTSKFLIKSYDTYELNYTLGVYIAFYSFFLSFLQIDKIIYTINMKFIFFTAINGTVTFFAFHFSNISLKLAPYNKISYIGYTQIVFSLIAGMIFFNENLNLLDFIGSFIIIGYNLISSKFFS